MARKLFLLLSTNELGLDLATLKLAQQEVMIVKLRLIVRRQGRKRTSKNKTLPFMMSNILAMLTIVAYLLVEAILELRRPWAILQWFGEGSKTLSSKVSLIVEDNLFVQVFFPCHIKHALGQALELLLKFLFPIMVSLGKTRDIMISESFGSLHMSFTRS